MTQPGTPFPLGRNVNHDPRSLRFAFADRAEAALPVRSVEWVRRAPILDQGSLGSCTGNAAAGWLGTDDAVQQGRADVTEALAVDIYSAATRLDDVRGQWPPDDTGSDGLSVCKVLKQRGLIGSYSHCFSLADVLAALQSGPVLVGTNWYDGMFNPGPGAVLEVSGKVAGGHEYLARRLDTDRALVGFDNSWGAGWGDAGSFWLTYDTLARLLSEDGDATVPHAVVGSPTPPGPGGVWFRLDPAVAAAVHRAAVRRGLSDEVEVNRRLRKSLKIRTEE